MSNSKKGTTLTLPTALIDQCKQTYQTENQSQAINTALSDYLLLPYDEQKIDDDAIIELLSAEDERNCRKVGIRIPADMLTIISELAGENNRSETVMRMLANILVHPLNPDAKPTSRLLYILGNKWNPAMQDAIKQIHTNRSCAWEHSVETCFGGCGIFANFNFAPNRIIADSDWNKANLLRAIQISPRILIQKVRTLRVNRETFADLKKKMKAVTPTSSINMEAAVGFLYLNLTSVLDLCESFDKNATDKQYRERLGQIYPLHLELQGVKIGDKDLFVTLKKYKKMSNTLFIVDPPYLDTTGYENRVVTEEPAYGMGFSLKQHQDLARLLRNIKQKNGNDFMYFCRITVNREVDQTTKESRKSKKELEQEDQRLKRKIDRLYPEDGLYYLDVQTLSDGTIERIITTFPFEDKQQYGKECE